VAVRAERVDEMRRIVVLAMSVVLWGGCTVLAGLDGNYVVGDGENDAGNGENDAGNGENDAGSTCVPMTAASCYSGPAETEGTGACKAGVQVCNELGTGYGPCIGEVLPKAEVCASPEDENCNGETACTGTHLWSKRFGENSSQKGTSVATDSAGNILLTGSFDSTVDFGGGALTSAGGSDLFITKLDPAGAHLWSKRFGDTDSQVGRSITTDSAGNVLLTGYFGGTVDFGGGALTSAGGSDLFIAKFDPVGAHLWSKRFGDAGSQVGSSITTDSADNVLLTGYFTGTVDFGGGALTSAGDYDLFVTKLDPAGAHLWSKRFGDAGYQEGSSITTDSSSNVLLTGSFDDTVDFGGGALTSAGGDDLLVAKLDPAGAHLWSKRFGDTNDQHGSSISIDSAGNVLLTGHFLGTVDFGGGALTGAGLYDLFVAKLDPAGAHLWSKRFGDTARQEGDSITTDSAGNVLLTGSFVGTVDFGGGALTSAGVDDLFVAKLDPAGAHLWSKRFGDMNYQEGYSITTDSAGNVLFTGYFIGTVDFGGGPLTSAGSQDIFVAKLAP
jgi:hypothetical protein